MKPEMAARVTKAIQSTEKSLRVLQRYERWAPEELQKDQVVVLGKIRGHYGIA